MRWEDVVARVAGLRDGIARRRDERRLQAGHAALALGDVAEARRILGPLSTKDGDVGGAARRFLRRQDQADERARLREHERREAARAAQEAAWSGMSAEEREYQQGMWEAIQYNLRRDDRRP